MLNNVTLQGRLTEKPEIKATQSSKHVTTFSLAVERSETGADGARATDFISVVAWEKTADFIGKYFNKGDQLLIEGRLQVRKWQDQNGANRYATEVIASRVHFCGSKNSQPENGGYTDNVEPVSPNDELPF